jgi:hypothetical protein
MSTLSYALMLVVRQLFLFIFDIIQATGGILNVRWAGEGQVITGSYCSAQGIIEQIGALGTSLIILVRVFPHCYRVLSLICFRHTSCQILAIHTFIAALWRIGIEARGFAFGVVGLTCVFIALWIGIGYGIHKNYEAPSPVSCFS